MCYESTTRKKNDETEIPVVCVCVCVCAMCVHRIFLSVLLQLIIIS